MKKKKFPLLSFAGEEERRKKKKIAPPEGNKSICLRLFRITVAILY